MARKKIVFEFRDEHDKDHSTIVEGVKSITNRFRDTQIRECVSLLVELSHFVKTLILRGQALHNFVDLLVQQFGWPRWILDWANRAFAAESTEATVNG